MNKLLSALLAAVLFCGSARAEIRVGFLRRLNIDEEEYRDLVLADRKEVGWHLMAEEHGEGEKFYFYDSLTEMQMALSRGDIDEAALPKVVGEYMLNRVPDFTVACVTQVRPMFLAFGFRAPGLRDRFNEALLDIKRDGTLLALQTQYLSEPGVKEPEPVKIERYNDADTVRIAVTGDLPPIDFVAMDGTLAGFNTAVLAEIGKRLHLNIEPWDIDSGARTAALASGRADAVFWYQSIQDAGRQIDVPDGVLLSESYYNWNKFLYIKKKQL